jgi:hypothetical protein
VPLLPETLSRLKPRRTLHWFAAWMVLCLLATQAAGLLHRIGHSHLDGGHRTAAAASTPAEAPVHADGCEHGGHAHAASWVLHLADALHGANSSCADVDHQLCADAQAVPAVALPQFNAVAVLQSAPFLQPSFNVRLAPRARGPPARA